MIEIVRDKENAVSIARNRDRERDNERDQWIVRDKGDIEK